MRMYRIAAGMLLASLSVAGNSQTKNAESTAAVDAPDGLSATLSPDKDLPRAKSAFLPELFASSHASNLLQLKNGDLLCVWFSGTAEGQSDVAIVVSILPKGSMTWGKTVRVDHDPAKSYQNPVAYQAPNGDIWILHTAQTAGKGQADAQVLKTVSKDGGKTWSAPVVLFAEAGAFTRQPFVHGERNDLLLPTYYSTSAGITKGAETNYPVVKLSADGGQTWKECAVPKAEGMVQMSIVKQAPGRYAAFYRSRFADKIHRSTSTDGCNWTAPVPTPLPNNNASIQAAKLRDGNIVVVFNNTSGHKPGHVTQSGERVPVSIALSSDGGVTWKYVRDMETRDSHAPLPKGQRMEYSYPAVLQLANGKIMASYTYRRLGIKTVLIDENWIKQGTTTGEYKP
ncbi:sialidase family protein [Terriglobus roseus]|uniref:Predicted neuraminidase (Sialidase) n=1 Tax=Terriglobus roseus TaxID=392734 RepID=A0A1G7GWT3_9BACT|nr:sialidase family protein [Terriglobus roseus]SDE92571.1 Predicted neuraminidase (sialidase) [Terriglobus roseus]